MVVPSMYMDNWYTDYLMLVIPLIEGHIGRTTNVNKGESTNT